eukprot:scaffold236740_cov35-Tisochrysis_lutea.AAC.1
MFLPRGGARRCWLAAGSPVRPYLRGWHQRCIPTECKTGDHTVRPSLAVKRDQIRYCGHLVENEYHRERHYQTSADSR